MSAALKTRSSKQLFHCLFFNECLLGNYLNLNLSHRYIKCLFHFILHRLFLCKDQLLFRAHYEGEVRFLTYPLLREHCLFLILSKHLLQALIRINRCAGFHDVHPIRSQSGNQYRLRVELRLLEFVLRVLVHLLQVERAGIVEDEILGILQVPLLHQVHLELDSLLLLCASLHF